MKTILVVEDDEIIAKAMNIRLRKMGYNVVVASDAVYAMDRAIKYSPDVAVLDINLPGGSGFVVAERMMSTAETAEIPVVFVTASKREDFRLEASNLGINEFLEKPFQPSELIEAIERVTH
jgi:DNA-binding response OmpR family regulator